MTGPILLAVRSLRSAFSRHAPVLPPDPSLSQMVLKYCPTRNFPHEPRFVAGVDHLCFFRKIIEFLLVIKQPISRCGTSVWSVFITICESSSVGGQSSCSFFRYRFLDAWRCLNRDLLSQFFTPIGDPRILIWLTELIVRNNNFTFNKQTSSILRTGCSENWISAFKEIKRHHTCGAIPLSVSCFFHLRSIPFSSSPRPRKD